MKTITTLAIDTSCDETSVSVVEGLQILSNVRPSQMEYHVEFGGVVPNLARLAHQERIEDVVYTALKQAFGLKDIKNLSKHERIDHWMKSVDYIAVTIGPGLAIALEVGINKAKELAKTYPKPLIPVNHMEGHLLSAFAERNSILRQAQDDTKQANLEFGSCFPSLGVLVSGGHTELVQVNKIGDYKIIGETLDDSLGECFDKCGRMLGLGYPAGPIISEFAKMQRKKFQLEVVKNHQSTNLVGKNKTTNATYSLPIPMARSNDLNMSYSGLKTAFSNLVKSLTQTTPDLSKTKYEQDDQIGKGLKKEEIMDLCVMLEACTFEQLLIKVRLAISKGDFKEIWLGGGVVASARLRQLIRLEAKKMNRDIKIRAPYSTSLTTDNAAMIGIAANINIQNQTARIYKSDFEILDRAPNLGIADEL